MKSYFIKGVLLTGLTLLPISVCFADAAMRAKIAEVKARMIKDFAPPKASNYLSPSTREGALPSAGAARSALDAVSTQNNSIPTDNAFEPSTEAAPKSSGSWYVQPGAEAAGSGSPSGGGFNHGNLY